MTDPPGSDDRTVHVWDATSGKDKFTLAEHIDKVTSVAFHPDGKLLASGSADKIVRLWNLANGKKTIDLPNATQIVHAHTRAVVGSSFSPGTW